MKGNEGHNQEMKPSGVAGTGTGTGGKPSLASHPVFQLGFRPFYLLGAAFAALSVPLWIARYFGWITAFPNVGPGWHMHEMVFGFILAIIVGFLFTAGRNWTGLWTPRGTHLAALCGLWLAGRAAMLVATPLVAAIFDLLFIPFAAWPLYRVLKQSGNRRNLFLIGLLGLLAVANAVYHLANLGWIDVPATRAVQAAILIVVVIETAIGGRVIPVFTANTVLGSKPVINPTLDRMALALVGLTGICWTLGFSGWPVALLASVAACTQVARLAGWKPHRTLHHPLLWILHVSYAWIPLGLFLMALAALGVVSSSTAFHALAVGSTAGLIIGMLTRTALGHTGRPLRAGRKEIAMYLLVQGGAVARLCANIDQTGSRDTMLVIAALSWSLAFIVYVVVYGPYLTRPRLDGQEG